MGIHGLAKLIADHAPSAIKDNAIKSYFGMSSNESVVHHVRDKAIPLRRPKGGHWCFYVPVPVPDSCETGRSRAN